MRLVIVDDGPTFDYRVRLFKRIVELHADIEIALYSEGYFSNEKHERLRFHKIEIKKGKYFWKYLGPIKFPDSNIVVFPFNWRIYNLIIFGLLRRYLFWGGGFRSASLNNIFIRAIIYSFSFISSGLLIYKTKKLKKVPGRLFFFHNISKLAYYPPEIDEKFLPPPEDYYLFIGTFKPEKCLYAFLQGYIANKIDKKLILIGDGPQDCLLRGLVEERGAGSKIIFKGAVQNSNELYRYLKNSLAVVSPGQCGLLAQDAIYAKTNFLGVMHPDSGPEFEELESYDHTYLFKDIDNLLNFLRTKHVNRVISNGASGNQYQKVVDEVVFFLKSYKKI